MSEEKKETNQDVLRYIVVGVGVFLILVLVFWAGMFLGEMKAKFSYRWAENYHKNFAGPKEGFLANLRQRLPFPEDYLESRGVFGEIIKINNTDFVIKGRNDVEKIVIIKEDTLIKKGRITIKKDDLKIGDQVVVIGLPNDKGQIEAKLIRVFQVKN